MKYTSTCRIFYLKSLLREVETSLRGSKNENLFEISTYRIFYLNILLRGVETSLRPCLMNILYMKFSKYPERLSNFFLVGSYLQCSLILVTRTRMGKKVDIRLFYFVREDILLSCFSLSFLIHEVLWPHLDKGLTLSNPAYF